MSGIPVRNLIFLLMTDSFFFKLISDDSVLFSLSSLKIDKKPIGKDQQMYLKAIPLKTLDQISTIKDEVSQNMIVILRITPIAQKNVQELKKAIEELYGYLSSIGGDIVRLGDERVVLTPPGVKIWRGLS